MTTYRWGILGTGNIANALARALTDAPDAALVAVASRTQQRADAFGQKWRIPRRHAGYAALAQDDEVDIVYIATPHSEHAANMRLCLAAGKHVLCEKAFTLNARQAQEMVALARANSLFLMEAMWMRFFPAMARVRRWLRDGAIGEPRLLTADFCVELPYDPQGRIFNPALGGGALLDLGIYPLSLASMILGEPDSFRTYAHLGATGVDELDAITLIYPRATAQLSCSMRIHKPREAFIVGSGGYIKIHDIFFRPLGLTLQRTGREAETVVVPYESNGYIHEVEEVHACLRAGKTESATMPLDETVALLRLMDALRARWGVVYPGE